MRKVAAVLAGLCVSASGLAQSALPSAVNLERFSLNPSGKGSMVLGNGALLQAGSVRGTALLQFANNVAVTRRLQGVAGGVTVDRLYGNAAVAYGFTDWLEGNLQVPVILNQGGGLPPTLGRLPTSAVGQPILSLKGGLSQSDTFPVSISLEVGASVPIGSPEALAGDQRPTPLARLNFGRDFGGINLFGELSFVENVDRGTFAIRRNAADSRTDEVGVGLGLSSRLFDRFSGEVAAQFAFDVKVPGAMTQLHAGLRYAATDTIELIAGGGPAFGSLMAAPDWRVFGGVAISSGDEGRQALAQAAPTRALDKCADPATATVADCPEGDADGDGIVNRLDNCPNDPEDKDGFADEDGCPDPDNDGDGIADADDKCPNEAGLSRLQGCPIPDQDKDGIADADDRCPTEYGLVAHGGCPIKDSDGDGIVDGSDACPNEAGLIELRGCPQKDSDGDGIADHLDNCPNEKGLANNSGCPAKNKQLVVIMKDRIEIKDRIYFGNNNARIQARSNKVLKQIAEVVKGKPHLEKIVIEGHTDDTGPAERNRKLSLERAEAVKSYLIRQGVDPAKLEARGIGPDRPIDTNKTDAGRANNRRVDFIVVQPEVEQAS